MTNIITVWMMEIKRGKENNVDNWLYRVEILQKENKTKKRKDFHSKGFVREKNG